MNIIDIFEDMQLQVVVKTTTACDVVLRGRYVVEATGVIQFLNVTVTPSVTDGSSNTSTVLQLPKGKLFSLDVSTPTASIQRGQLAVSCGLLRDGSGSTPFIRLMTGYVTTFKGIDLNSGYEDLQSGRGYLRTIQPADPVAGTGITKSFLNNVVTLVRAVTVNLNTAATIANRKVFISIDDGIGTHVLGVQAGTQAASLNKYYSFMPNSVANETLTAGVQPLQLEVLGFPFIFFAGSALQIDAENIQAADQLSGAEIFVEEWINN